MSRRTINLTFHGTGPCERPLEPGEDGVWLGEDELWFVLDAVTGRDDVRIMVDDGNISDVDLVLPALQARGLRATFFIVAGRLGDPAFVGEDDIRALADAGMGIGCHGMRHRPWRRLGDGALREELVDAKKLIEGVVGCAVDEAACPFGAYDRRVLAALRANGYGRVYTSDRGPARPDAWLQPRNTLRNGEAAALLEDVLTGYTPVHETLVRQPKLALKRWR
jgi:peptidoglycan/xylan/chitin deacetylase (PgdA/CDA1 family)